jgi:tRNA(Leu) C34 or U34 (ribose-2'-O)-methylase TrmL
VLASVPDRVRIPIYDTVRSLNLATAAGILLVQAMIGSGMMDDMLDQVTRQVEG